MHTIFPWQQSQWQRLITRKKNHALPHALLLTGPQGIGKFIFAKVFAEFLLCEDADDAACGKCKACRLLMAGTHPDLFILQPEEGSKNIKVDQIRSLIEALTKTSQQGNYQIVIIEPPEAMNTAANNALLKTLEEPPGNVILILVSHQPGLLLATLRSRCQIINFTTIAQAEIKKWLMKQISSEQNVELLLALAEQTPLQAAELAKTNYLEQRNNLIINLLDLQAGRVDPTKSAAMLNKIEFRQTVLTAATLFADLIKIKFTNEPQYFANLDKITELQLLSKKLSLNKLFYLRDQIIELNKFINKNINLNSTLALENLFVNFIM